VFRLLGLLGGLSLGTDLGTGAPLDQSLRRCVMATRLARAVGCGPDEVRDVVFGSLLQHLGCTAYAHETARVWGDDVGFLRVALRTDLSDPKDVWREFVPGLAEVTGRSRAQVLGTALTSGRRGAREAPVATCEVARAAARQLGLPDSVQDTLFHGLTQWNGRGYPAVAGTTIPRATRIVQVASTAVLASDAAPGPADVAEAVRLRAGTLLDPELAEVFAVRCQEWLGPSDEDPYDAALDCEPDPVALVGQERLEAVAQTFGALADLKSPWLQGHSAAVARLAGAAAETLGLPTAEVARLRVSGHLHDLGRLGVPSRLWDKPTELTRSELEQARLHPYHSERILSRVPTLGGLARLAGLHHERLDGSGYHRGVGAVELPLAARVLAAADAYRVLVEDGPRRPGSSPERAAARLRAEVRGGALDRDAVSAVLSAAGQRDGPRPRPSGLTERQVEVLRLVARGRSNREIAEQLGISPRTAEHHVQDVYQRVGRSTRAGAALFAMEHGLLDDR
jgi:HD-GYP domain-containing protein (c-di-GMP phosphodiesterase class II)